jgi:hypothetical protein
METVFKDIPYGVRSLLKRPAFTMVAVITLGLGIGVNTAIFSVINAVLLRLVRVSRSYTSCLYDRGVAELEQRTKYKELSTKTKDPRPKTKDQER